MRCAAEHRDRRAADGSTARATFIELAESLMSKSKPVELTPRLGLGRDRDGSSLLGSVVRES
jgi:hypothetical protein